MPSFKVETDIPDLEGQVCLVTGANSGIGEATVAAIAQHNPRKIYLAARSRSKAEAALSKIKAACKETEKVDIEILELDLVSFDSIKKAASHVNASTDRLDKVVLNAGVASLPASRTTEGYEMTFGVNYVGHVLLTQLLMPKLLDTAKLPGADVRVTVTSSVASRQFAPQGGILFDTLKTDMASYANGRSLMIPYGQSNVARNSFALELAKRYPSIKVAAAHPGTVRSNIWEGEKSLSGALGLLYGTVVKPFIRFTGVLPDEGAKNQLWCTFAASGVESGAYYEPIGKRADGKYQRDEALARKLWDWTDQELKEHGSPGWPASA